MLLNETQSYLMEIKKQRLIYRRYMTKWSIVLIGVSHLAESQPAKHEKSLLYLITKLY